MCSCQSKRLLTCHRLLTLGQSVPPLVDLKHNQAADIRLPCDIQSLSISIVCPHLFANVPSFLRSQLLQPISSHVVQVAVDPGLEGLVLPDGRRAEGAACKLT